MSEEKTDSESSVEFVDFSDFNEIPSLEYICAYEILKVILENNDIKTFYNEILQNVSKSDLREAIENLFNICPIIYENRITYDLLQFSIFSGPHQFHNMRWIAKNYPELFYFLLNAYNINYTVDLVIDLINSNDEMPELNIILDSFTEDEVTLIEQNISYGRIHQAIREYRRNKFNRNIPERIQRRRTRSPSRGRSASRSTSRTRRQKVSSRLFLPR